ncbi:N-acetylmuramoyl-L-alanine amidase family protein [Poseidonocella pacifica]|uniref:N-acetylmuramoyl-L-alanine amidase family protein n=1 Tax=Poseidonocella pacifica TaxID=871651 RepID=UPI001587F376|nr:N-acetylmuramoyl-L-alanine amidase [Poseidonocella pacifica]
MYRLLLLLLAALWTGLAAPLVAESARIDPARTEVQQLWRGVEIRIGLSRGVPYRAVFHQGPPRITFDLRDADLTAFDQVQLQVKDITSTQVEPAGTGWARLTMYLARPLLPGDISMSINEDGSAQLIAILRPASEAAFRDVALPAQETPELPADPPPFRVVIDPGHGGHDPGAEYGRVPEKTLMLAMARDLAAALPKAGADIEVVLTRDSDVFVGLEERLRRARAAGGGLFISLHADAVTEGEAHGATVHLLSPSSRQRASQRLTERHDRSHLLEGHDLTGTDDRVAHVLLDLARQSTSPRTERLARGILTELRAAELAVNSRPIRRAGFSVLKAADMPSILLELGFLSSERDRADLNDPAWRQRMAAAIAQAVTVWAEAEDADR